MAKKLIKATFTGAFILMCFGVCLLGFLAWSIAFNQIIDHGGLFGIARLVKDFLILVLT